LHYNFFQNNIEEIHKETLFTPIQKYNMPEKYYTVTCGRAPGVYTTWKATQRQIVGYPGGCCKSFPSRQEAEDFFDLCMESKGDVDDSVDEPPRVLPISGRTIIYTDGSSKDDRGGYGIVAIKESGEKVELYGPLPNDGLRQTNNQSELYAIKVALETFSGPLTIYTDSEISIKYLTVYIHIWKNNNWKSSRGGDVENQVYIKAIDNLLSSREDIKFIHVNSHQGLGYNDLADKLANQGRLEGLNQQEVGSSTQKHPTPTYRKIIRRNYSEEKNLTIGN